MGFLLFSAISGRFGASSFLHLASVVKDGCFLISFHFFFFFPFRDESYILSILPDTEHSCEGWMKYNRQSIWEKMPGKRISSSMYRTDVIIDLGRKGLSFEIIRRWRADNSFNHVQACVSDKNLLSTSFLPPFYPKNKRGVSDFDGTPDCIEISPQWVTGASIDRGGATGKRFDEKFFPFCDFFFLPPLFFSSPPPFSPGPPLFNPVLFRWRSNPFLNSWDWFGAR